MDRYSYNRGYQDCMRDITVMLHKERVELEGHGDPMAIWWSKYWDFGKKIHKLWQLRFKDEQTDRRN